MRDDAVSGFGLEVLEVLTPNEAHTVGALAEEMRVLRKMRGQRRIRRWLASLIFKNKEFADHVALGPSFGAFYPNLLQFEQRGWVSSDWRKESPERIAQRNGYRLREYWLTEPGEAARSRLMREAAEKAARESNKRA